MIYISLESLYAWLRTTVWWSVGFSFYRKPIDRSIYKNIHDSCEQSGASTFRLREKHVVWYDQETNTKLHPLVYFYQMKRLLCIWLILHMGSTIIAKSSIHNYLNRVNSAANSQLQIVQAHIILRDDNAKKHFLYIFVKADETCKVNIRLLCIITL